MHKLYIQVDESDNCINHPAFEDNLIQAFGKVPSDWQPFNRIEKPILDTYQLLVSDEPKYQKIDGVWSDVWEIRDMTEEEKIIKQKSIHENWNSQPNLWNFTSWIFNEKTCQYEAPISKPNDGKDYFWQGITNSWQIRPARPNDGKEYALNNSSGQWELLPQKPSEDETYIFNKQSWTWIKK